MSESQQITDDPKMEYRIKRNADKAAFARKWRLQHAELLKSKITCECGTAYSYANKSHHMRTKKHNLIMEMKNQMNVIQSKFDEYKASH